MPKEASWKPQGAAGNTKLEGSEFTESKGNFNRELRGLIQVWKIDDKEEDEQMLTLYRD